jgi:glutathione synthase/RimK-type ligase-like ATP-grasp enzyme
MNIYLITTSDGFYGQMMYPWEGIDLRKMIQILEQDFNVIKVTFNDIATGTVDINDELIIYTSSQQQEYKQYIEDIILYLSQKNNILIPSINMLRSHNNKGYQELHKRLVSFTSIPANYYSHYNEMKYKNLVFPLVLKTLEGFGSGGVSLVNSEQEIEEISKRDECLIRRGFFRRILSRIYQPLKRLVKPVTRLEYGDYYQYFRRFVVQDFIPNLSNDYKVLIVNQKYYVLTRFCKEGDFRASGSGIFAYEKADSRLLDYAENVFRTLDEPMLSIDICSDNNEYYLIEFQGLHFGPYAVIKSKGYYQKNDGEWGFVEGRSDFEEEVALSLLNCCKRKSQSLRDNF